MEIQCSAGNTCLRDCPARNIMVIPDDTDRKPLYSFYCAHGEHSTGETEVGIILQNGLDENSQFALNS